jgi:hypothetical protein
VLADSSYLDNQPHWYPLFEEDQSTRFGCRPRVQMISPSDSSESSTTTRHSSIDSLGGATSAAGLDASVSGAARRSRKKGTVPAGDRFRADPDGSPILQQVRAGTGTGVNSAAGSGATTPRRRPYGHESPAAVSGGGGSMRRDTDENLIVTEDSFDNENEECMDELFLKHHDVIQELQKKVLP